MEQFVKYQDILNLDKDVSFGMEIEYENIIKANVDVMLYRLNKEMGNELFSQSWTNNYELDIGEFKNSIPMNGEVKSPILFDNKETWIQLRKVLELLRDNGAVVTNSCGGHVNIGTQILGDDISAWKNFLLLWILYEQEVTQFSTGEFDKVRVRNGNLFSPVSNELKVKDIMKSSSQTFQYLRELPICVSDKHHSFSLSRSFSSEFAILNTIEFRIPNGTLREEIFQNYVNFFAKFLCTCKKDLDKEKIIYKIKKNKHNPYELSSLVFTDDLDKHNFLIQTLKTNKTYQKSLIPHLHY